MFSLTPSQLVFTCFVLLFGLLPSRTFAHAIISEVAWAGSDLSTQDEWVELTSLGSDTDLSGFTLTSLNTSGNEIVVAQFAPGTSLTIGQTIIIAKNPTAASRLLIQPFLLSNEMTLPNTKLLVRLRDANGVIVDQADDGVGSPLAGLSQTTPPKKASMQRIALSGSGMLASSWITAIDSVNLSEPTINFGNPGIATFASSSSSASFSSSSTEFSSSDSSSSISVSSSSSSSLASSSSTSSADPVDAHCEDLRISEVLPNPTGDDAAEWIELKNAGAEIITLSACSFSLTVGTTAKPLLISTAELEPDEFLVLPYSQFLVHLPNGGANVLLKSGGNVLQTFSYPATVEAVSYGLNEDGDVVPFCVPSPGSSEAVPWQPGIDIESGALSGVDHVSLNIKLSPGNGTLVSAQCSIDFGDGHESSSCNPPSHTYSTAGEFLLTATSVNYCGTTATHTLNVHVEELQMSSASSIMSQVSSFSTLKSSFSSQVTSYSGPLPQLIGALPNPSGTDTGKEQLEFRNTGSQTVPLSAFSLRFSNGDEKRLSGELSPGRTEKIFTSNFSFTLKNTSETLSFLSPSGEILSVIAWSTAEEGRTYHRVPLHDSVELTSPIGIDGDTFTAKVNDESDPLYGEEVTVRLIGVDAPETVHPTKKVEPYGIESSNYFKALIKNKKVELHFDSNKTDIYGRLLGYVFLDGELVQEKLIKEGYARADHKYDYERKEEFLEWEADAQESGKGLWFSGEQILVSSLEEGQKSNITSGVIFNEIYAAVLKTESGSVLSQEWMELFNASDEEIDLSGWKIQKIASTKSAFSFPSESVIEPHQYLLVFSKKKGLTLNDAGSSLELLSPSGSVLDHREFPQLKKGQSYARNEPQNSWCITQRPTPEQSNICEVAIPKTAKKRTPTTQPKKTSLLESKVTYVNEVSDSSVESDTGTGDLLFENLEGMLLEEDEMMSEASQNPSLNQSKSWSFPALVFCALLIGLLLLWKRKSDI